MSRIIIICIICALANILGGTAFGQGVDPLIGTWKLNLEKSTVNFPLPKSVSFTVVKDGQNMVSTVEGVNNQGQPTKQGWGFSFGVPRVICWDANTG